MRILHVISGLGTGGAETMLLRLLTHDSMRRHASRVVSLTAGGGLLRQYAAAGLDVRIVDLRAALSSFTALPRLRCAVREFVPDVIQGWMNHGNVAAYFGRRLAGRRAALVWNIRQTLDDIRAEKRATQLVIRIEAMLSSAADVVLFNSAAAIPQHAAVGFKCRATQLLPNGFDTELFRPDAAHRSSARAELGIAPDQLLVGLVARYHPMKDHETFIRSIARLRETRRNVRALLVGPSVDNNSDLQALVEQLQLQSHVVLRGERAQLYQIYPALDVACLSSAWGEGLPNAVGEAMACGVPCVVTDVGDAGGLVGDTGMVVSARDPRALADGLGCILSLADVERRALGTRARERIVARYSIDRAVDDYLKLYERLVSSNTACSGQSYQEIT